MTLGIDLPQTGLVFAARTVALAQGVGVVVTVLAALRPAIRATRVPPVAAVREGAVLPPSRLARFGLPSALCLVGGAVVGVLAAGLKARFESSVTQLFRADYALTAADNFTPLSTASAQALRRVPGVTVLGEVRAGDGRSFGSRVSVSGVDAAVSRVISLHWQAGDAATPGRLRSSGALVSHDFATAHQLRAGSPLLTLTPSGTFLHLVVEGIFTPPPAASPFGDVTISTGRFDSVYTEPANVYTLLDVAGGVTPATTARLRAALAGFPDAKLQTEPQFISNQEQGLDNLLNLLYVLLSPSIVISLFGIVNTLVLTVFERTRELGMLRAVGMTRRQVRRMIRHESIVTALLGATFGARLNVLAALRCE